MFSLLFKLLGILYVIISLPLYQLSFLNDDLLLFIEAVIVMLIGIVLFVVKVK